MIEARITPAEAIKEFGALLARKLRLRRRDPDIRPQLEEQIREPVARLLTQVGRHLGLDVLPFGEVRLTRVGNRPDFGVDVGDALVGFIELKAPGRGIPPECRLSKSEQQQWAAMQSLPNVLYTDGSTWGHYTYGVRDCVARLVGDLEHAGDHLVAESEEDFVELIQRFLRWPTAAPPSLRILIRTLASLCQCLRDEVCDALNREKQVPARERPFTKLARDWRDMLFPKLKSEDFPDAYAQTITFALLLSCATSVGMADRSLPEIASLLKKHHPLMGQALVVLSNSVPDSVQRVVTTIIKVLAPIDWGRLSGSIAPYWVIYEDFLEAYDKKLKRKTGSYYTPDGVARFMVDFTDRVLKRHLKISRGLAADNVVIVDPAMGTGTFLVEAVRSVAETIRDEQQPTADVSPYLRELYERRLVGFERQAMPYAVAELRLSQTLQGYGVEVPKSGMCFLADTFDDPEAQLIEFSQFHDVFQRSREDANKVKLETPVMVVIANPPYLERAQRQDPAPWIGEPNTSHSIDQFRLPGVGKTSFNLASTYIYFWRWATWKVFDAHEGQPNGAVTFITPAAFLTSDSYAGMRRYLRETADEAWIIDLSPEGYEPPANTRIFPGVRHQLCIAVFVRRGQPNRKTPAKVRVRTVSGERSAKLGALTLETSGPDAPGWAEATRGWTDPFGEAEPAWQSCPALGELMPWRHTGVTPNRAWPISPDRDTLRRRWQQLVRAPDDAKPALLKTTETRTIDSRPLGDAAVPSSPTTIRDERELVPRIAPIAFHSFDRQFIIFDRRVIDRERSALWYTVSAHQVFVTEQHDQPIRHGPGLTFTELVPYVHHYGGRGGCVRPLYRDSTTNNANLAPGLLNCLSEALGVDVTPEDLLAYVACVTASRGYSRRFVQGLRMPGVRVPLTSHKRHWNSAVEIGQEVIWLHTYGNRYSNDRHHGIPRLPPDRRPIILSPITVESQQVPSYDATTKTLHIGDGEISPISAAVWEYRIGTHQVIPAWFEYRKSLPGRLGSNSASEAEGSPLDGEHPVQWTREFQDGLINLLNVLGRCVELEPIQEQILKDICEGPLISVNDLTVAGVVPADAVWRKFPRVPRVDAILPEFDHGITERH